MQSKWQWPVMKNYRFNTDRPALRGYLEVLVVCVDPYFRVEKIDEVYFIRGISALD